MLSPYKVNLSKKRWICVHFYIYVFIANNSILFIATIIAATVLYDEKNIDTFASFVDVMEIIVSVELILQAISFSIISWLIMQRLKLNFTEFYK